mmetsp:Transcript_15814/g.40753  ORF Transcript_15814/g.40753 Transcript_15814/m.40753 type:complete len:184 (+) Transcript_15814:866-1417(+)
MRSAFPIASLQRSCPGASPPSPLKCTLPRCTQLAALRRTHAAGLREEQGCKTSEVAAAAVAVATATAAELLADNVSLTHSWLSQQSGPSGAHGGSSPESGTLAANVSPSDWTIVPAEEPVLEASGWSLVEKAPPSSAPARKGSSLSFVILQLEAPRVLESHFDGGVADLEKVQALSAELDTLL